MRRSSWRKQLVVFGIATFALVPAQVVSQGVTNLTRSGTLPWTPLPTARADSMRALIEMHSENGRAGRPTSLLIYVDILSASTPEEFHAQVRRLPVLVRRKSGVDAQGRNGVVTEYIHRSGRTLTRFTAPPSNTVAQGITSGLTDLAIKMETVNNSLRSLASLPPAPPIEDLKRAQAPRGKMLATICSYEEIIDYCADEQEMEDFNILTVTHQADADAADTEGVDALAFLEWCDSYEVSPEECPSEVDEDMSATPTSVAFRSGPSAGPPPFEMFRSVGFVADPNDFAECAKKHCGLKWIYFSSALTGYLGALGGMWYLGVVAAPIGALYAAALAALSLALAMGATLYELVTCVMQNRLDNLR